MTERRAKPPHTQVPNIVLEAVTVRNFNGSQFRILTKVWRSTYGYHVEDYEFSISFLQNATGLSYGAVKKEVSFLIKSKVLAVTKEATHDKSRRMKINENIDEWEVLDMTSKNDSEGFDCDPQQVTLEGFDCSPLGGFDCSPQVITQGGSIVPPSKEKVYKEKDLYKETLFDDFYDIYPRKISKQAALKAWAKLSKEKGFNAELIINHTRNFAETCLLLQTEKIYIAHPSTYLNQKKYEDYDVVDPEGLAKGKQTKNEKQMDVLNQFFLEGEANEQGQRIYPALDRGE